MAKHSRISDIARRIRAREKSRPLSELDLRPPAKLVGGRIYNGRPDAKGNRLVYTTGEARG